jgi:hypothetical protein
MDIQTINFQIKSLSKHWVIDANTVQTIILDSLSVMYKHTNLEYLYRIHLR